MSDSVLSWPDFLVSRGAVPAAAAAVDAPDFPLPAQAEAGFLSPLTHLGVISATGDDAADFLHNQLSNDVLGLDATQARLAGYCSPKGRLLATLLIWRDGDQILLALPRTLLAATLKRLQMFVLRARVKLSDASEQLALIGIAARPGQLGALPAKPMRSVAAQGGMLLRVPDAAGLQRAIWAGPASQGSLAWNHFGEHYGQSLPPAPAALWRWTEIMAGLPQVVETTREQFVPQMINFELVGGVNFQKGCYPGQEIVARSQYLGKLKRRALLAFCDSDQAAAGAEVFSAADPAQPCGMIANAERGPDDRIACLVELKMEWAGTAIHIGSAEGPPLNFGELPYALPATE